MTDSPPPKPTRRWRRWLARAAEAGVILVATGALVMWCSVPNTRPLADENPTSTAFIDLRRAEAESAGKKFDLQWQWRPLGKISRYLRAAVIYAEDYNFYRHEGVDWDAVEHAIQSDLNRGQLKVGGSTITQQLAKNLYLSPKRSLVRKAREMLIAFALDDHLSKQRILELYLNVVEWGDGVFGAEAASKKWFGHSAQYLSPAEAARLAIALPNPIARAPNVHTAELAQKAVRLVRLFRMQGLIDAAQERASLDQLGATDVTVLPDHAIPKADPEAAKPDPEGPITTPTPSPDPTPPPDPTPDASP